MIPMASSFVAKLAGPLHTRRSMVRKFVFVPGAEPRVAPRQATRATSTSSPTHATKVMQWVLLGLALAVSAVAFSAAKRSGEVGEQPSAAANQRSAGQ